MRSDPYARGLIDPGLAYPGRVPLEGGLVVVMDLMIEGRDLQLEAYATRVFQAGDVCELIVTGSPAGLGERVPDATYLGFARFDVAGLLVAGDDIRIGHHDVGRVIGFDSTHLPNHYNVVLYHPEPRTGHAIGLAVGDVVKVDQDGGGQA